VPREPLPLFFVSVCSDIQEGMGLTLRQRRPFRQ
jgi:hypothetical protein